MGCIHSKPHASTPPDIITEYRTSPKLPKPFDSSSSSNQNPSSRPSVEFISPLVSITLPTPSPARKTIYIPPQPPKQTPKRPSLRPSKRIEPPDLPTAEVTASFNALVSKITSYETLLSSSRERTLSSLSALLPLISENSPVFTKLEILIKHIDALYFDAETTFETKLLPICIELPTFWSSFISLSFEDQREEARIQGRESVIMGIFKRLGEVRACCGVLEEVECRIERMVVGRGEELLKELFEQGGEASMLWSVLGVVVSRRKAEAVGRIEEVRRVRMGVSKGVMGVLDSLDEWEEDAD